MKWVRYVPRAAGLEIAPRVGLLGGDQVYACRPDVTLLGLIRTGGLPEAGTAVVRQADAVLELADVRLCAPIETPPSIRDFMAFERHVEGMGQLVGATPPVPDIWYQQPLYYFTNPTSLIGPYDDVAIPPGSESFDFELEVAAIVGPAPGIDRLTDLTVPEAAACIVGYALMNDWTARDLQAAEMQGPLGPCKGKDSAIGLGPWLLTSDELPGLALGDSDVVIAASINGVGFGNDRVENMAWTFAEMVAYASRGTTLQPGDLFGSGTCANGCIAERWGRGERDAVPSLQPGTRVSLDGGPLGSQQTRVVRGQPVRNPLRRLSAATR